MDKLQPHSEASTIKTPSRGRAALGVLLLLPALFCCASQLLLPTVRTFLMSFQRINLVGSEKEYIGLDNYSRLFGDEKFWRAAGFTFITLLVRLLVVLLVPLLLAWAAGQFGRPVRLGLRILLTLPLVFFVPAAIAVAWLMFLNPVNSLFSFGRSWAASPASARSTLLFIDALYLSGLAVGLGLMAYLPLWRRSADVAPPAVGEVLKPMLVTWAVAMLGIIVVTLSTFTLNFMLTNGGPAGSTTTLGMLFYQLAFRNFTVGPAASIASLILLVTLALGIATGVLVVWSRLRLDLVETKPALDEEDGPTSPGPGRGLPGIILALLVLLMLGTCLFSALPFVQLIPQAFDRNGLTRLLQEISAGRVFINTFVPPFVAATLQVLVAYLAALGIGALRPIGDRSEWLLLLFSPWLFITVLPLSLVNILAEQKAGRLDTFIGSLSPILISVPALFILTLFFTARASRLQRATAESGSQDTSDFFRHFISPSLPLIVVLWLLLLFFNIQDIFWPLLVSIRPESYTLSVTLIRLVQLFGRADSMLAAAIVVFVLPVCIFFFICLVPFQIFYLDRLALFSENPSSVAAQDPEQNNHV